MPELFWQQNGKNSSPANISIVLLQRKDTNKMSDFNKIFNAAK